ncbi:uncharacterized protein LOC109948743 [Prunus persica]|uniref:uncharacterized protein LOC109948743 n=1 Tax=Prunus persica TaxID=3760 RepID=UPI0009AB7B65|nr:uncharacterized protein LOC109948743 [Prunus persica]
MATLPSRKMFISSSSIKPTQDPIQLATDELESKLRNGEAFSAIFFHLLATPARNPSSQASEAKLNHRRDLQEVQLARTSSSRVCRNPPPGHLLAPTLFPSCGKFGFSQITGESLPKLKQESRESFNHIYLQEG